MTMQRYLILSNVYGDMIYTLVLTLQRGYSWEFLFGVSNWFSKS